MTLSTPLDRWLALSVHRLAPAPDRVEWLRGAEFAHRGLHDAGRPHADPDSAPRIENSPSAFAAAIARGLGIECDVQLTADGHAAVFHDFTLDRLTAATGPVAQRSAAELATLALGATCDTLPMLGNLLAQVGARVPLLIEVKMRDTSPVEPLCAAVATALAGYAGAHAVMSFDPRVPHWFSKNRATTPRGLVMSFADTPGWSGPLRRHKALRRARPDFLALDIRDLPNPFAATLRNRGLPLACWTIRSPEQCMLARAHVDALIAEGAGVPPFGP